MNTISDLENLKNQACFPFGSAYDYLMATLEDYYIAKSNGTERIKKELENWDQESRKIIIDTLIESIGSTLQNFSGNDLRLLI